MLSRTSRRTPPRELDVTKVRIKAALNDVSVDMVTINEPLFKASVSGLHYIHTVYSKFDEESWYILWHFISFIYALRFEC